MDLVAGVARRPKVGETVMATEFDTGCGGKGANQAIACAKLGGKVALIGCVGDDGFGQTLVQNAQSYGVDTSMVRVCSSPSGIALITVCKGNNSIIVSSGANAQLTESDVDNGLANAVAGDILLAQLEVRQSVVAHALKTAKAKGMTTILNPAPATADAIALACDADIIIPNETETAILTAINPIDEVHLALAVKHLYKHGAKKVVITLGGAGSAVIEGQHITFIDPIKVRVVDTTAAGDTYVGALACRLDSGDSLLDACHYANRASSITVTRAGAAKSIPTAEEVQNA